MPEKFKINIFLLASSFYISFQLFANILSTKIALLPILNMSIDGGTVIYPLTFTLRDFVHKTCGKIIARQVIFIAAGLNLIMFGLFWLVGRMTPDPVWGFQAAYEQILLPIGRIVLASIIAQVISELIDTEVFGFKFYRFIGRQFYFRSDCFCWRLAVSHGLADNSDEYCGKINHELGQRAEH